MCIQDIGKEVIRIGKMYIIISIIIQIRFWGHYTNSSEITGSLIIFTRAYVGLIGQCAGM